MKDKNSVDNIAEWNLKAAIAFALMLIAFLLAFIAFYK